MKQFFFWLCHCFWWKYVQRTFLHSCVWNKQKLTVCVTVESVCASYLTHTRQAESERLRSETFFSALISDVYWPLCTETRLHSALTFRCPAHWHTDAAQVHRCLTQVAKMTSAPDITQGPWCEKQKTKNLFHWHVHKSDLNLKRDIICLCQCFCLTAWCSRQQTALHSILKQLVHHNRKWPVSKRLTIHDWQWLSQPLTCDNVFCLIPLCIQVCHRCTDRAWPPECL